MNKKLTKGEHELAVIKQSYASQISSCNFLLDIRNKNVCTTS